MTYEHIENMMGKLGEIPLMGKDDEGNVTITEINGYDEDGFPTYKVSTSQANGWLRVNVYWKDGTVEEYYEK